MAVVQHKKRKQSLPEAMETQRLITWLQGLIFAAFEVKAGSIPNSFSLFTFH